MKNYVGLFVTIFETPFSGSKRTFPLKKIRSDAIFRATCENFQHIKYLSSELLFKKLELNFFENEVYLKLTKVNVSSVNHLFNQSLIY